MKPARFLFIIAAIFLATPSFADVASDMAKAANTLLASLDAKQKAQATFKFTGEERTYWHFIPAEML